MRPLLVLTVFAGLAVGSYSLGLRWNGTPSMPIGVWRVAPYHRPVVRGDAVVLCLPDAAARFGLERGYLDGGDCPGRTEALIKTVAAVAGDCVMVSDDGISVNGQPIHNSRALRVDAAKRSLPAVADGPHIVGPDEVWIISQYDHRSYDSRYYAAVPASGIIGIATPFLTTP